MNSDLCLICGKSLLSGYTVTCKRGMKTLFNASFSKKDNKFADKFMKSVELHVVCRRNYTRRIDDTGSNTNAIIDRVVRSANVFDIKSNCLFCGSECRIDSRRPSNDSHKVRDTQFQSNILAQCEKKRTDVIAKAVMLRLSNIIDLVAAKGRYHGWCYRNFVRPIKSSESNKAGTDIVFTALGKGSKLIPRRSVDDHIVVIAEDVVFNLLIHHSDSPNVFMQRSFGDPSCFHISTLQEIIGSFSKSVLFVHGATGCDSTSAHFKKGKIFAFNMLRKDQKLAQELHLFNTKDANPQLIANLGEKFLLQLYGAPKGTDSLDELRYIKFNQISARLGINKELDLATLPPTKKSATQHFYRTYYQVQEWLGNKLNPLDWGWILKNGVLTPNTGVVEVAPEFILKMLFCNCDKSLCKNLCSCRKFGLLCTTLCGKCCGMFCTNKYEESKDPEEREEYE